ncbi:MAG: hypothetical protein ABI068_13900, partial [Ktedonobacterales bacterium]
MRNRNEQYQGGYQPEPQGQYQGYQGYQGQYQDQSQGYQNWDEHGADAAQYGANDDGYAGYENGFGYESGYEDGEQYDEYADANEERGLMLQTDQSLVGVSTTITHHGSPLLSYSRT